MTSFLNTHCKVNIFNGGHFVYICADAECCAVGESGEAKINVPAEITAAVCLFSRQLKLQ